MKNFKQYYLANEGIRSRVSGMADAAVGGLKKGINRAKKAVTGDKGIVQKAAGLADAGIETVKDVGGGVGKEVLGAADEVTGGQVTGDKTLADIERIETYEDLRAVVDGIIKQKQQGEMSSKLVDTALSEIPGLNTATTLFDLLKAAGARPDEEVETQTGSVIDKLDVDDQLATIVDDKIESNFLAHIQKKIETQEGPIRTLLRAS